MCFLYAQYVAHAERNKQKAANHATAQPTEEEKTTEDDKVPPPSRDRMISHDIT